MYILVLDLGKDWVMKGHVGYKFCKWAFSKGIFGRYFIDCNSTLRILWSGSWT